MTASIEQSEHFESLLVDNNNRLIRIARSYAPDQEVEDLLQDIRMQLWRSRGSFSGKSHVNTWLYRIALNTAISFSRRRKVTTAPLERPEQIPVAAQTSESLYLLEEFLRSLNPVNRSVLLMYLDGLSHTEIGAVLGSRPNAVAVRLNRIKQDFEKRYVEDRP